MYIYVVLKANNGKVFLNPSFKELRILWDEVLIVSFHLGFHTTNSRPPSIAPTPTNANMNNKFDYNLHDDSNFII